MRSIRSALMLVTACICASCAGIPLSAGPKLKGDVSSVSSADIQAAIAVVQRSLVSRGHTFRHVYLVEVTDHNAMLIYCARDYGTDEPVRGELAEMRRVRGKWKITRLDEYYEPNVIVTGMND